MLTFLRTFAILEKSITTEGKNPMKNILATILILAGSVGVSHAQNSSIGVTAGSTTGAGISYRYLSNRGGVRLTLLPYISTEDDKNIVLGGFQLIKVLSNGNVGRSYLTLGTGFYLELKKEKTGWEDDDGNIVCHEEEETNVDKYTYAVGPGIGFDIKVFTNFILSLELPVAIVMNQDGFQRLAPIPNLSLGYEW